MARDPLENGDLLRKKAAGGGIKRWANRPSRRRINSPAEVDFAVSTVPSLSLWLSTTACLSLFRSCVFFYSTNFLREREREKRISRITFRQMLLLLLPVARRRRASII